MYVVIGHNQILYTQNKYVPCVYFCCYFFLSYNEIKNGQGTKNSTLFQDVM